MVVVVVVVVKQRRPCTHQHQQQQHVVVARVHDTRSKRVDEEEKPPRTEAQKIRPRISKGGHSRATPACHGATPPSPKPQRGALKRGPGRTASFPIVSLRQMPVDESYDAACKQQGRATSETHTKMEGRKGCENKCESMHKRNQIGPPAGET